MTHHLYYFLPEGVSVETLDVQEAEKLYMKAEVQEYQNEQCMVTKEEKDELCPNTKEKMDELQLLQVQLNHQLVPVPDGQPTVV